MTHINRQKFLTELSKFLTFLNEEELQKVLEKFESIFDRSDDEDELASSMESPLKMTVEMSRAYTKGGLEEVLKMCDDLAIGQWISTEEPNTAKEDVIQAIDEKTFESIDIVTENEMDLPDAPEETVDEASGNPLDDDGLVAVFEQDMREQEEEAEEEVTGEEYSLEDDSEDSPEEESQPASEEEAVTEEPEETGNDAEEELEEPAEEPESEGPEAIEGTTSSGEILREEIEDLEPKEEMPEEETAVRYKARWWALIPYLIVAIPLGIIGVAVCAAITAAILAVAAGLVAAVVMGASLALESGMDVIADIILVAGATLVATGLALLVIWLAVWFAVNTIGGIIGGLCRLGKKWCYKEVVTV